MKKRSETYNLKMYIENFLSIELIMGSIIVLWYVLAYYCKVGILAYYNIPSNFINVELKMLFVPELGYFTYLGVCVILFIFSYTTLLLPFNNIKIKSSWKMKVLKSIVSIIVYVLLPPYFLSMSTNDHDQFMKYYIIFLIIVISSFLYLYFSNYILHFIYYLFKHRKRSLKYKSIKSLVKSRHTKEALIETSSATIVFIKYTGLFVFYTCLLCTSAYLYGYNYLSSSESEHYIVESPDKYKNRLVVDSYNNSYITLPIKKKENILTVESEIKLIKQEDAKIKLVKTGKIEVDTRLKSVLKE
ncbi:hypothetical protein SAMN05444487_102126 [Marininema mesophilum]|uniref:Uncharacterized protein n=1 Tax=Marininema mesophilum TaxID=1048340 RepID=A0A1H2S8U5_9BACL|nr:hypothetical protein [Marininema mesophilum]SDW27564.1 hypothetical protein SAMN05444487_102126 [Marininema mesophilum]